jgi:hypothetical protein
MNNIGTVQGNLRAAHLKYHSLTLNILTPQQLARYSELRGYKQPTESNHTHYQ